MATIAEAKAQVQQARTAIANRLKQIQATKLKRLTRAELGRRSPQDLITRRQQGRALKGAKAQAVQKLKPITSEVDVVEGEIRRAELAQKAAQDKVGNFNRALEVYKADQAGDKDRFMTLNEEQKRLFKEIARSENKAQEKFFLDIKSTGATPVVQGGKVVSVEYEQTPEIMDKLRDIGINVERETIVDLPSTQAPGVTARSTVRGDVTSIDVPSTREKVSKFLGIGIPSLQRTFNIITGQKITDPISVKKVIQSPSTIFTGISTIAGSLGERGAKEFDVEKKFGTIEIPATEVPQRVTTGGGFVLPAQEVPALTVKEVGFGARVGTELGLFAAAGGSKVVSGVLGGSFVSTGVSKISKGQYLAGGLEVGIGATFLGSSILRTIGKTKIIKDPIPETKTTVTTDTQPIIKDGKQIFISDVKVVQETPARTGVERSLFFDEPFVISKPTKRISTASVIGTGEQVVGAGVQARIGKTPSTVKRAFQFEGQAEALDIADISKLPPNVKRTVLEGLGEEGAVIVREGQTLGLGEVLTTKLPKTTKTKDFFKIVLPKLGKITTRETLAFKTTQLGKGAFGDTVSFTKLASSDITKSVTSRAPSTAEIITKVRKPKTVVDVSDNIISTGGGKTGQGLITEQQEAFAELTKGSAVKAVEKVTPRVPTKPAPKPTQVAPPSKATITASAGASTITTAIGDAGIVSIPKQTARVVESFATRFTGVVRPVQTPETNFLNEIGRFDVTPSVQLPGRVTSDPVTITTLDSDLDVGVTTRSGSGQKGDSGLLTGSGLSLDTEQGLDVFPILDTAQTSASDTVQLSKQPSGLLFAQPSLLAQELTPIQKTPTRQRPPGTPTPPGIKIPLPPGVSGTPLVNTLSRMKARGRGVDVIVGINQKKRKVIARNVQPFTGLKIGRRYTDRNLEASFKLKRSGKKATGKKTKPFNVGPKFRSSKVNPLFIVEKKKYRLDMPGERRQIKLTQNGKKKLSKRKKKKK